MNKHGLGRSIKKILVNNLLTDLSVHDGSKEFLLLGPAGPARELSFLPQAITATLNTATSAQNAHSLSTTAATTTLHNASPNLNTSNAFNPHSHLPVLIGSGMGHALKALLEYLAQTLGPNFNLAIVDKEEDILKATALHTLTQKYKNVAWVKENDPNTAVNLLSRWQIEHDHRPFYPIINPAYLRLDRPYYSEIRTKLEASAKANFWGKTAYSKFKGDTPKILLITSGYFLIGDVQAACERMGLEYRLLNMPNDSLSLNAFVEQLLTEVVNFKPDFALTINHLGVDREGMLSDLLARIKLPLASWFVDNPHLILYRYTNVVSPWTSIFTWDSDNINSLRQMGFEHVEYLPLGTDHMRFTPQTAQKRAEFAPYGWQSRVSFVGNSMVHKVEGRMKSANPSAALRASYKQVAANFAESDERSVKTFLEHNYPQLLPDFDALSDIERQLSYETLITWEATLQYRLDCVKATLPFNPLILGDDGWFSILPKGNWRYHKELSYYVELPYFYPFSEVNFNCTSKQMKGAVNQRIFDVPAAASFIITDWREQIENLFEPGKEVICYNSPEEATNLIQYYLNHQSEKEKIVQAARKRVLAQHCYEHRMQVLIAAMRKRYA
ncbi:DUF3880 domain-containing protein [Desulfovibrio sp. OttesenSCG-928-F07]|nr:DUF3880 domain-containing protein [Desulfovibrio sp. OttesenSCG-928-F07]